MREMIRHAMLYHANQFTDASERIQQARAVVDFLSNAVPVENNHYGILLKDELKLIRNSSDAYLFHDHMERLAYSVKLQGKEQLASVSEIRKNIIQLSRPYSLKVLYPKFLLLPEFLQRISVIMGVYYWKDKQNGKHYHLFM